MSTNGLRATEEVVRIDEHPELGIKPRLAVGLHAGGRPLGSIWVQQGATPLADNAELPCSARPG